MASIEALPYGSILLSRMRNISALLFACVVLAGCGDLLLAMKMDSFSSDSRSFIRAKDETIKIVVIGERSNNEDIDVADGDLPSSVLPICRAVPPQDQSGGAGTKAIPVPVIVAAATILYGEMKASLDNYIDRKVKEFTQSYDSSITLDESKIYDKGIRCIEITRNLTVYNQKDTVAMRLILAVVKRGNLGYVLRPAYLRLDYAKARTAASEAAVDIAVTVGISAIQQNMINVRRYEFLPITQQNLTFRGVSLSGSLETAKPKMQGSPFIDYDAKKPDTSRDSAVFVLPPPLPDNPTTMTIAIAVTEVGAGADSYTALKEAIDRNSATVSGALGSVIQAHYAK